MDEAKRLRIALADERSTGRGRGKKAYSTELQRKIVSYLRRERATGRAVEELIASVGISRPTYYAWVGAARPRVGVRGFRQMAVVPTPTATPTTSDSTGVRAEVATLPRREGGIVVMVPGGIAVVGMSVADVAELARRLGC